MSVKVSSIKITDNSSKLLTELEEATLAALHAVGLQAVKHAVEQAPYDTGLLKNSLTYALDGESPEKSHYNDDKGFITGGGSKTGTYTGNTSKEWGSRRAVYIGTNVKYAIYQEYGTSKTPAQPFLRPAATNYTDEYKAIIKTYMQGK